MNQEKKILTNELKRIPGFYINANMIDKIILIAEMYYSYGLSQMEIAEKLEISRPWVSKLLNRALEMGFVRIEVISHRAGYLGMEQELISKYGIKNVFIVKNSQTSNNFDNIGTSSAFYLLAQVKPGDIIGVSWGLTISTMVEKLIPIKMQNLTIIPLVGGLGTKLTDMSNIAAMKMADIFSAKCNLLHAPAFCASKEERDLLISNPQIQDVIEQGKHTNIAILSVGALLNSTIMNENSISAETVSDLQKCGAVGDIALRFIDKNGNLVNHEINQRTIACPLEDIVHAREVICLGSGEHKVVVLDAALKGKWFTTLFTDVKTAEALLNYTE